MANANKQKGDRAERAVRDYVKERYPGSFRTRAGFDDDLGDVIALTPAGAMVLQVKDVAKPEWGKWFHQLSNQVRNCTRKFRGNSRVVGGVIVHKTRGVSTPSVWKAVVPLDAMLVMLDKAYSNGFADGRTISDEPHSQEGNKYA